MPVSNHVKRIIRAARNKHYIPTDDRYWFITLLRSNGHRWLIILLRLTVRDPVIHHECSLVVRYFATNAHQWPMILLRVALNGTPLSYEWSLVDRRNATNDRQKPIILLRMVVSAMLFCEDWSFVAVTLLRIAIDLPWYCCYRWPVALIPMAVALVPLHCYDLSSLHRNSFRPYLSYFFVAIKLPLMGIISVTSSHKCWWCISILIVVMTIAGICLKECYTVIQYQFIWLDFTEIICYRYDIPTCNLIHFFWNNIFSKVDFYTEFKYQG